MIRTVGLYFYNHPEGNTAGICNGTGYPYTLRDTKIQGWYFGRGATTAGTANNVPNNRVTDTGGQVLLTNGQLVEIQFLTCGQEYTNDPKFNGRNYVQILTDADGVFGPNRTIDPGCATAASLLPSKSVTSQYSFASSMTNGSAAILLPNSTKTASITTAGQSRQAEVYYGHAGMDMVSNQPFGQSGQYLAGWHLGDKVEYKMEIGGAWSYLHLIGIADRPAAVILNIYVDGYYKGTMQWNHNDNLRHLNIPSRYINGLGSVAMHRVAIEFANDVNCSPAPTAPDCDRNFYFDLLAALTTP